METFDQDNRHIVNGSLHKVKINGGSGSSFCIAGAYTCFRYSVL